MSNEEKLDNLANNLENGLSGGGDLYSTKTNLHTVHTYADDMAKAVKEKQGSVMKIAMAEEERRREEYENFNPSSKRNVTYIFATIFVLVVAAALVGYSMLKAREEAVPVDLEEPRRFNILDADETKDVFVAELGKDQLYGVVSSVFAEDHVRGSLTVYPIVFESTDIQASSVEFLEAINTKVPSQFKRVLSPIFDIGVFFEDEPEPFFLFATTNYDTSFSAMLAWEATLYEEFAPFFGLLTKDENGITLGTPIYGDKLIANRNARIVVDRNGNIIFLYSLLDESHILIASDPETMKKVVERISFR